GLVRGRLTGALGADRLGRTGYGRAGGLTGGRRAGAGRFRLGLGLAAAPPDLLLDVAPSADLFAHLNLLGAVLLEQGLGQVAQEVVLAVAMGDVGELGLDALDEGLLFVRQPQLDRLAPLLRPALGLDDQALHLVGAAGEPGLGEPDALAFQLADDVEGLVALLRLQAVDGQDQAVDVLVVLGQPGLVLVAGGDHAAVACEVAGDGVVGQADAEAVAQLSLELRDGPV